MQQDTTIEDLNSFQRRKMKSHEQDTGFHSMQLLVLLVMGGASQFSINLAADVDYAPNSQLWPGTAVPACRC